VLLENVSGILAGWVGPVLGDLVALGYDTEWDCVPASAFGAPHRRDRWWCIATDAEGSGRETRSGDGLRAVEGPRQGPAPCPSRADLADADRLGRDQRPGTRTVGAGQPEPADSGGDVADSHGPRRGPWEGLGRTWPTPVRDGWWAVEPDVGRVAHGIPGRVDRLRGLGDSVVPQVAEHIGRLVLAGRAT
jgi:DNA (cytosine-5)-methyltransferase 1